jgi:DNA-binding GntR family transcriptional regulator
LPKNTSTASSLAQIHNKSLREHVLEMLRAAIVNGELKPGQTLVEAELAAQLGVSRAPLREAMNILGSEGLLEVVPYHGSTVKKLARKDIEELFAVRSMMEVFSIRSIIAAESTAEIVEKMRAICCEMEQAADEGDLGAINQLDRHFHDTLVASGGNDLLLLLWGTVSMRVRQVMSLRNRKKGDLHGIARNHHTIVDLIVSQDIEAAVKEITLHIGISGDVIAEAWEADTAIHMEKAP